jgi:hypothetical protein
VYGAPGADTLKKFVTGNVKTPSVSFVTYVGDMAEFPFV